jgi:hypothetical protein
MLELSPEIARIRAVLHKRLMDEPRIKAGEKALEQMVITLHKGGFVVLEPAPPKPAEDGQAPLPESAQPYTPVFAHPTPELNKLLVFRSIHPLYGAFLINQLGIASREERLQAMESVLEIPRPLLRYLRVPRDLPAGPLATTRLDEELIRRGLVAAPPPTAADEDSDDEPYFEEEHPPTFAEKLGLYFEALYPDVTDIRIQSIWCAAELLQFGGNFNKFIQSRDLAKQEGIVFRHLLRLILLCGEFAALCPPDTNAIDWQKDMQEISDQLTASCRTIDPTSTDEAIEKAHAADVVEGEAAVAPSTPRPESA